MNKVGIVPLVKNETVKILKKKRFLAVILIIAAIIPLFTYAQMKESESARQQFGTSDWRVHVQQQITDYSNRLGSNRVPEEWKRYLKVQIKILQYYYNHNIDPEAPSGVTFMRNFMDNAVGLFLPLMIMVIAADLVSSEHTIGTIKLLLTRPVRRWKVLLSKYLALSLYVSLIIVMTAALSYLISGAVFGLGGWNAPTFIGFNIQGSNVDLSHVELVPQWKYLIMELGLIWFPCMSVAFMSLMISVLIRSTAASMGTMLAILIAGTILVNMASAWKSAKYLFNVNLQLTDYLSGTLPPISGMTLPFSITVLTAWTLVSVIVSFWWFSKKDVLNS